MFLRTWKQVRSFSILPSLDNFSKREYNYEYEEGKIIRATEAAIDLSGEIVTAKVIVNTVKYYYETECKLIHFMNITFQVFLFLIIIICDTRRRKNEKESVGCNYYYIGFRSDYDFTFFLLQ